VDGVDAVDQRDAEAALERGAPEAEDHARHASGVFTSGLPPPPEMTDPRPCSRTSSGVTLFFSGWVIWPIFSRSVMRARRASARGAARVRSAGARLTIRTSRVHEGGASGTATSMRATVPRALEHLAAGGRVEEGAVEGARRRRRARSSTRAPPSITSR
jgi:hypothetical protein